MSATPTSSSSTPHSSSTPQPQAPTSSLLQISSSSAPKLAKGNGGRPKATNVFTNDGSFLERFQRSKKEEEEKKKTEDDVMKKRNFDERFKKRGKRPVPDSSASDAIDDPPPKKTKGDKEEPLTQYEKEVKSYAGRSLKDDGIGVRPLVK